MEPKGIIEEEQTPLKKPETYFKKDLKITTHKKELEIMDLQLEFDDNLKTQKGFIGVNILGLQKYFDQNEKNFERRDKERM